MKCLSRKYDTIGVICTYIFSYIVSGIQTFTPSALSSGNVRYDNGFPQRNHVDSVTFTYQKLDCREYYYLYIAYVLLVTFRFGVGCPGYIYTAMRARTVPFISALHIAQLVRAEIH